MDDHINIKITVLRSNRKLENTEWKHLQLLNEADEKPIYSRYLTKDDYDKIDPELIKELIGKAMEKLSGKILL